MKIIGVYNIKGGVGKTATAVNLAYLSARAGRRTLVWDLDPQGASTFYFRIKPKVKGGGKKMMAGKSELDDLIKGTDFDGLDLLPADFSYRNMDLMLEDAKKPTKQLARLLKPMRDQYDHVYLDCPPSISLVSENVFRAADLLLVPMIPTTLSVRTLEQLREFLDGHGLERTLLLPFFSMVDRRKTLHRDIMAQLSELDPNTLAAHVPYSSDVEKMGVHRAPLPEFAAAASAARAGYEKLWGEVMQVLHD